MNDTASPPGHRRKSKGRRRALIAAVVVAAAGTWYGVHTYRANKAAKEGEYIFAAVERGDIEDLVTSTGTLQPRDYVDVGAQVSGQIEDIFVEVGDVVEVGQKLVKIDATTSEARVEANRAQMESAKINLATQKANLEKSRRDFQRLDNLLKDKATTQEQWQNAKTALENQERSVKAQEYSIQQTEANQRIEAKNLQYTTIVAPIAGTVMKISVKKGQTVNASQNVPNVLQIANLSTMTVQSDVSEADYQRLTKGTPVYFTTLGGGSNRRWYSTLKRIEPTPKVTQSVVTYNALFDVENDGNSLTSGMTTQVYYVINEARNVVKVPMAALQQGQQFARQEAERLRKEGKSPANGAGGPGMPGAMGSGIQAVPSGPGATAAPPAGAAGTATAAAPAGGNAPAAATATAQGNAPANAPANRQANGNAPNGSGGFGGQRPGGNGGNFGGQGRGGQGGFGGQRPGGQGGFGGRGGGNFQNMTAQQREEMMRQFQNGGGGGNFRGGGNFQGGGNFNRQGGGAAGAAGAAAGRASQRRNGTVMVKKADGTLESRRVVYGVSDRVFAEVIEGLKEGEEVVVGKRETEAAAAAPRTNNNNNQNFNQGNFNQGGRGGNFQGGGGRPF